MLDALRKFHTWLRTQRDPDEDGLVSIVSPFESGLDWSAQFDCAFDNARTGNIWARWLATRVLDLRHLASGHLSHLMLRRFDVEEIATNAIWYEAQVSLAELASMLGDRALAESEAQEARRTRDSLLARCWNCEAQAFFSLYGKQEQQLRIRTVASLLPLILDGLTSKQVDALVGNVEDSRRFATPVPLPSVAADEPTFLPDTRQWLWRGPSWLNMNWYVVRGLLKYGHRATAQRLVDASVATVQAAGFWECFQPYTGKGMGAPNFAWTTLVVDMQRMLNASARED
jgi:glycogen debranching enzyme